MKNTIKVFGIIALVAIIGFSFIACDNGNGDDNGGKGVAPTITTASLPNGTVGTAYSQTLAATGDTPITWSLESGTLPTGLTLATSGTISGTPSTANTFTFTVKATNNAGSITKSLSITIASGSGGTNPFIGKWNMNTVDGVSIICTDSTWTLSSSSGTYTYNGNTATFIQTNGATYGTATISGNTMTIVTSSGGTTTWTKDSGSTGGGDPGTPGLAFTLISSNTAYKVSKGTATATEVVIPATYNGLPVTQIEINEGFRNYTNLTKISIPASITNIGYDSGTFADVFRGSSNLTEINVDASNTSHSSINGVLFNKDQTQIIRYTEGKTGTTYTILSSVTSIERYAFQNTKLTSITIPTGVLSIGANAFYNSSLTSVTIQEGVTTIENSAFDLTDIVSITIPASVTSIGVYGGAFKIYSLTDINVNASNANYSSTNGILFNKSQTQLIRYPRGKTGTSYTIPSGVTVIEGGAFDSVKLNNITIPLSVTSIGTNAFLNFDSYTTNTIQIPFATLAEANTAWGTSWCPNSIIIKNSSGVQIRP